MPSNGGGGSMSLSDRFFSYETFKVLRVRDRRLGGLYRLFQATILLYIASSIIYQQRYLKTENVINGAVRVTLQAPADGIATPAYCTPPAATAAPPPLPGSASPCLYWSSNDILYEPGVDGALITTRAQITQYGPFNNQTSATPTKCDVNAPIAAGCDPHSAPTTLLLPTSLVADIERFTLMLEHSIRGQATGLQIRSGNMEAGVLRDSGSGEVLKTFTDQSRYVPAAVTSTADTKVANGSVTASATATVDSSKMVHLAGDVMTVGEFLKAAGVNLDEISTSPSASVNETVRSSGIVVIVVIQYAAKGWNPNKISYEYLPKAIPDQEYKVIETIRDFRGGNRVEINRHGIRIVFSQAGQLGQFSLMTLLTNLVAAVALFKVANIIVELMMLRLHPQKKIYTRAKFEHAKNDVPPPKRDGTGSISATGLEELTASEEQTQTGTGSNSSFRGRPQHDGLDSETVSESGSSISALGGSGKTTGRSGGLGESAEGSRQARFSRRGGIDEEAVPRNQREEPEDFLTSSDDSGDSDTDVKKERRRSYVQDSLTKSQSSSVDPTRSQLRVIVSRQSNDNLSGYESKDACRSVTTPISTNGTVGRQHGNQLTKAASSTATAMSGVDWNRNGSSSALSGGDVTPGVARTTTTIRPTGASIYGLGQGYGSMTSRDSTDEIEIETRFGPVRPNEFKGFNPGGLSLTGTPPLSPSPSQARYAFGGSMRRGSATPERSTAYDVSTPSPIRSAEPFSAFRSPATMQATSPSPVSFGHHHHDNQSSVERRGSVAGDDKRSSSRTKKHPSIMKSTGLASPTSPHEMTRTLKSRHSSGSLSSLSSSSSMSSLASFCEGGDLQRSVTPGTMTSFGLCQSGAGVGGGSRSLTSTWSYGLPDSPLRGECSGGESLTGFTTRSTTPRHCSKKDKYATTGSSGGREHKKRRKEYSQATLAGGRYESPLQSKSEVILTRPMFGLGSSSNMSSFSLSLAASTESSSPKDVKGKYVDSKWSVEGSSSVSTPTVAPSTTTAFNVMMAPFHLPMPAYFSQGLGSKLDLEDALTGLPSSSSSSSLTPATTSTTLGGKQPQRGGNSLRRTLRSSVSSPSLLTSHRDTTSAIAATSGLPVQAQLASHSDLPPKSGTVEPSLISSSSSSSRSSSVSGQDATISSRSFFDSSVPSATGASSLHSTVSGDERTARSRLLNAGSVGHFAHTTLNQGGDNRSNTPKVAPHTGFQGTTPALVSAVSHFSESSSSSSSSSSFAPSDARYPSAPMSGSNVTRTSVEYPFTRIPSSSPGVTSTTTATATTTVRAAPLPLRPILSTSSQLQSHQQHPLSPYSLTPFPTSSTSTTPIPTSSSSPALGGSGSNPEQYYTNPTSTFFTSPITSSCVMTIPETGVRVLGPTITMITEDNRRLVLRRSAALVLNEGVGEEKAARM